MADHDKITNNSAPNGYLRDSPWSQLRFLPRLLAVIWRTAPATVALLVFINACSGVLVVAEVHALRRLVETAQEVIQGGANLIDAAVWPACSPGWGLSSSWRLRAGFSLVSIFRK